jgi:hypothetical protein
VLHGEERLLDEIALTARAFLKEGLGAGVGRSHAIIDAFNWLAAWSWALGYEATGERVDELMEVAEGWVKFVEKQLEAEEH